MTGDLHGDVERSRETLWARKEDAKALEALRRKLEAETEMNAKLTALQHAPKN